MSVNIERAHQDENCFCHPDKPAEGGLIFANKDLMFKRIGLCGECLRDVDTSTDLFIHEELDNKPKQCKFLDSHPVDKKVIYCTKYNRYTLVKKSDCGKFESCPK